MLIKLKINIKMNYTSFHCCEKIFTLRCWEMLRGSGIDCSRTSPPLLCRSFYWLHRDHPAICIPEKDHRFLSTDTQHLKDTQRAFGAFQKLLRVLYKTCFHNCQSLIRTLWTLKSRLFHLRFSTKTFLKSFKPASQP